MQKKNVLIVEDDAQIRSFVRDCLMKVYPEANIVESDNGFSAFLSLSKEKFSLIVTDLKMPYSSGEELFEAIRKLSQKNQPENILILSGYIKSKFTGETPFKVTYMEKPFKLKDLEEYFKSVLL